MKDEIYTPGDIRRTYENVHDLLVTKHIIKTYSTNRRDIRDIALRHLDLSSVRSVLDLGCGYGFFIEKLKGLLDPEALITGIDLVDNYEHAYLDTVSAINYRGSFIRGSVDLARGMASGSYGLVLSSYSLYFFPHIVPQVARLLAPGGIFIAITHSEHSLEEAISFVRGCMSKLRIEVPGQTALCRLFAAFSVENGLELLGPWFGNVERIAYKNSMVFGAEHLEDCIYYLEKKRALIYKEVMDRHPGRIIDIEKCISAKVFDCAKTNGSVAFNKDDGVFICTMEAPAGGRP